MISLFPNNSFQFLALLAAMGLSMLSFLFAWALLLIDYKNIPLIYKKTDTSLRKIGDILILIIINIIFAFASYKTFILVTLKVWTVVFG